MESFGFNSVISHGNQSNRNILELNRQVRKENNDLITRHQNDITRSQGKVSSFDEPETRTLAETIGGQVASKGKDIQAVGKVIKSAPQIGEAVLNVSEDALFGSNQFAIQGVRDQTVGTDLIKSATDYLKTGVSVGKSVGEKASSIGKLGIASTGLSIGLGLMDAVDDISSHKIEGKNSAEKVSNVAGMVSGGLEAVGTALDLTGVGAPVGVALNLLGGLAGLVGGGSDLIGENEERDKAVKQQQQIQNTPPTQQKLQSLQDIESSGSVIKSSY